MLRGGAYKPRTSPYAFQGLGQEGLRLLAEAKERDGPADRHRADGRARPRAGARGRRRDPGRRAQHAELLAAQPRSAAPAARCCSSAGSPATLEELLMAAEYILKEGNEAVMLCERGIRTFETAYRFTLDLTAVPVLKQLTHLPVVVDPSHAAGPARPRRAAVARRRRGRCRRHHRRGAPEARRGDLRRARRRCAPTSSPPTRQQVEQVAAIAGKELVRGRRPRARVCVRRGHRRRADRRVGRPGGPRAARRRTSRLGSGAASALRARRASAARSTRRATPSPRRCADADVGVRRRARSARCPALVGEVLAARAGATASSPTSARPSARSSPRHARRALRRRAPARGRRDRRRRARARRPLRGRHLVPDADARDQRACCYERLHRLVTGLGARPAAIDADDARPR